MHKKTWIKVNVQVDEGIKELVEALSAFPKLQTIESCQGSQNTPAWVCFYYGNSISELSDFVLRYLGKELAEKLGDRVSLSIQIKSSGLPQGELQVRHEAIRICTKVLKQLAS
ncbi:MAG TPA: hypothetical protein VLX61_04250 [Anaerolineales bacterium]|nr:hypothetical protein [Anaerolineales bacterium]